MRRRAEETISLFSFQDIMASVIGMLFFVVIMLALSIVNEASPKPPPPSDRDVSTEVANLRREVAELRAELARLEARAAEIADKTARAATSDERSIRSELRQLHANLSALYGTIVEEEKKLQEIANRAEPLRKEIDSKQKQLQHIEEEIAKCKAQLREAQSVARIAFIIDKHPSGLEPLLLELSGNGIRIGGKDARGAVVEFRAELPEDREKLFFAWAKNQNPRTHYFVILLKPSAIKWFGGLAQRIKDMGFDIGLDLLPEEWQPY